MDNARSIKNALVLIENKVISSSRSNSSPSTGGRESNLEINGVSTTDYLTGLENGLKDTGGSV